MGIKVIPVTVWNITHCTNPRTVAPFTSSLHLKVQMNLEDLQERGTCRCVKSVWIKCLISKNIEQLIIAHLHILLICTNCYFALIWHGQFFTIHLYLTNESPPITFDCCHSVFRVSLCVVYESPGCKPISLLGTIKIVPEKM